MFSSFKILAAWELKDLLEYCSYYCSFGVVASCYCLACRRPLVFSFEIAETRRSKARQERPRWRCSQWHVAARTIDCALNALELALLEMIKRKMSVEKLRGKNKTSGLCLLYFLLDFTCQKQGVLARVLVSHLDFERATDRQIITIWLAYQ